MQLTEERANKLLAKIQQYRKTKEDNIFDSFYHTDLDVFETLVKDATVPTTTEEVVEK